MKRIQLFSKLNLKLRDQIGSFKNNRCFHKYIKNGKIWLNNSKTKKTQNVLPPVGTDLGTPGI